MSSINWLEEVQKQQQGLIDDTQQFLRVKSVLDETTKGDGAPFGEGIAQALSFMLEKGKQDGFVTKDLDGYAGHIEMGQGEELIGVLCHVDVVPEGDGWKSDPYAADIRNGNIYARGAIDDKGPTMAAYYAMKIVKELGLPLRKRIRMILGTDEESHWRCVEHYFRHEEMPTMGFAPDADFPIINAEKGICDLYLAQQPSPTDGENVLLSFQSGRRLNMVPDYAKAIVQTKQAQQLAAVYEAWLQSAGYRGKANMSNDEVELELTGRSAHGSTPEKGENAGVRLAGFLAEHELDKQGAAFVRFVSRSFGSDTRGIHLGIQYNDDITGDLTVNVGLLSYRKEEGGTCGLNIRYPVTTDLKDTLRVLRNSVGAQGFGVRDISDSKPHHVDKEHVLVRTLQRVYEEQMGEKAELLAIGGGTYARSLQAGVAFGPLFPGKEELAHQKDEYIEIEDLLRATAIYAQAIYELAK
ncbi:dipeptidase PepV [Ectobacillus funiculus]|uniref:Dipeptidase PepV n=1 Tax=Ectobacillus funiculus TaxID=137993 RepID=A0ABV5WHA5_9BACI